MQVEVGMANECRDGCYFSQTETEQIAATQGGGKNSPSLTADSWLTCEAQTKPHFPQDP